MEKYKLKPLTTEEKEMAANNHNIVYAFLYQHGYSIDNFYGVAVMGFLKGIQVYLNIPDYFTPPVRSLGTTIPVYGYH